MVQPQRPKYTLERPATPDEGWRWEWEPHWLAVREWLNGLSLLELAKVALLGADLDLGRLDKAVDLTVEDCDLRRVGVQPEGGLWDMPGIHQRAQAGLLALLRRGPDGATTEWGAVKVPAPNGDDTFDLMYDATVWSPFAPFVAARIVCGDHFSGPPPARRGSRYSPQLLVAVCSEDDGRPCVLVRAVIVPAYGLPSLHNDAYGLWSKLADSVCELVPVDRLLAALAGDAESAAAPFVDRHLTVDTMGLAVAAHNWLFDASRAVLSGWLRVPGSAGSRSHRIRVES
jgi:hypothetical protein